MTILKLRNKTFSLILFLNLMLGLNACGGSAVESTDSPSTTNTSTTVTTNPDIDGTNSPVLIDESIFPVVEQGLIRGVNIQGAFRSSIHPEGSSEQEIINRISYVITLLGFNSIRIGGTSSFGGSFDETHKGFGWSKFANDELVNKIHPNNPYLNEPYNFNVMAIKVAAQAGVSVWIDLSTKSTQEEIDLILSLLETYSVSLAGMTRDNEPYLPERFEFHETAYNILNNEKYRDAWWPGIYVINGEQSQNRKTREQAIVLDVNTYREDKEGIELHIYYPKEAADAGISPNEWLTNALNNSETNYGTSKFMVGEWSGKNQETFDNDELEKIIDSYLTIFEEREIPYYYQLLGSGTEMSGLWNFKANDDLGEANRGAQVFIQHHCGDSCL